MRRLKDAQRLGLVCRFSTGPWNEIQDASFSLGRSEERGTVIADRSVVGGAAIKCTTSPLLHHPAVTRERHCTSYMERWQLPAIATRQWVIPQFVCRVESNHVMPETLLEQAN